MDFRTSDRPRSLSYIHRSRRPHGPSSYMSSPETCALQPLGKPRSISCRAQPPRPAPSSFGAGSLVEKAGRPALCERSHPSHEFQSDTLRDNLLFVGFLKQLFDRLFALAAVIEGQVIHI